MGSSSASAKVKRQFDRWRRCRQLGSLIPDELWSAATDLGCSQGVSRTAHLLGLDYYALKKRVEAREQPPTVASANGFVEFVQAMPPACVLEVRSETGTGIHLRMELHGLNADELGRVACNVVGPAG